MSRLLVVSADHLSTSIEDWLWVRRVDAANGWVEGARGVRGSWVIDPDPNPHWLAEALVVGIDVALRPVGLRPALVAFDGDGTLLEGETIDELGREAGCGDRIATVTARAMAGEIDFAEALRERVQLLRGLPDAALNRVASGLRLQRGAEEMVVALRAAGLRLAIFSGGFHFLLDPLAARWGFDRVVANRLGRTGAGLTGELEGQIIDAAAKAKALRDLARECGVDPGQTVAVGDGANDLPLLRASGFAVGIAPKPVLLPVLDAVIASRDLRALVDFLA